MIVGASVTFVALSQGGCSAERHQTIQPAAEGRQRLWEGWVRKASMCRGAGHGYTVAHTAPPSDIWLSRSKHQGPSWQQPEDESLVLRRVGVGSHGNPTTDVRGCSAGEGGARRGGTRQRQTNRVPYPPERPAALQRAVRDRPAQARGPAET